MLKSYKYRIYPNDEQRSILDHNFGCVRLVYNLGLEVRQAAYCSARKSVSFFDMCKQLVELKNSFPFLKEANSQSLQFALRNLDNAYQRFFKRKSEYPEFKKKHGKQSFQLSQNVIIDFVAGCVRLPKIEKPIAARIHRKFFGKTKVATIIKTSTGKYFISVVVEGVGMAPVMTPDMSNAVGIDLGIKTFAVLSNGDAYDNPKYLRNTLSKLKWAQRQLSRKKKGSNRRAIWKQRVALIHEKVTNQRKDFLDKVSNEIINRFDHIFIEDLNIAGMTKNHKLAFSINDAVWGMFAQMLEYKATWKGKKVAYIGRFEPSSKICGNCGIKNNELKLSDREWTCENCNTTHDRDINAAKNILAFGLRKTGVERTSEYAELPSLDGAMKRKKRLSSVI